MMTSPIAAGTKFMQEVNSAAILGLLRQESPLRVTAIAERVGLSRQAVSRSLMALAELGYVEISEPDREVRRTGRPPQMVRFRAEAGYVVGVDLRPKRLRVSIADLNGEEVASCTTENGLGIELVKTLKSILTRALSEAAVSPAHVWHGTVSTPGIVDTGHGTVTFVPGIPAASGRVLVETVESILHCPVEIDNDVKIATQGERWHDLRRDQAAFVFVDWGEQIGAGIVVDGVLHRGYSNDAGDIGYLELVVPENEGSESSDLGAFERYAGTRELCRIAAERSGRDVTLASLSEAFVEGEEWALSSLSTIATRFARGIAVLRAIVDPQSIVIGGDMAISFGDTLADLVSDALAGSRLTQPLIEISQLGNDAVIRGAIHQSLLAVQRDRFEIQTLATPVA